MLKPFRESGMLSKRQIVYILSSVSVFTMVKTNGTVRFPWSTCYAFQNISRLWYQIIKWILSRSETVILSFFITMKFTLYSISADWFITKNLIKSKVHTWIRSLIQNLVWWLARSQIPSHLLTMRYNPIRKEVRSICAEHLKNGRKNAFRKASNRAFKLEL